MLQQATALVLMIILFLVMIEFLSKYILARLSTQPIQEFPRIEASSLDKFKSFDPELGWERQPNEIRTKTANWNSSTDNKLTYSTDEYGSRICSISRESSDLKISTHGGSYCFCREVQDQETFQHFLSKDMGIHVSNYGVGNYGLDQSIKRLKRRHDADPADYVIMVYTSASISRTVSVWKYYLDFRNTFAVKPRYDYDREGNLVEVPCIINEKEDLLSMEKHKNFLRKHDYHYENNYIESELKPPYTAHWLSRPDEFYYSLFRAVNSISRSTYDPTLISTMSENHMEKWRHIIEKNNRQSDYKYFRSIAKDFSDLYSDLLFEFGSIVSKKGATPVYLPLYNGGFVEKEIENGPMDQTIIDNVKQGDSNIVVLENIRDQLLSEVDDISELYVGRPMNPISGHHTPKANKMIAQKLAKFINQDNRQTHRS